MSHPHCSCPCHRGVSISEFVPCCDQIGVPEHAMMPVGLEVIDPHYLPAEDERIQIVDLDEGHIQIVDP